MLNMPYKLLTKEMGNVDFPFEGGKMTFNPIESMVSHFTDAYQCPKTCAMDLFIQKSKQYTPKKRVYPKDHLSHTNPELWKKKQEEDFLFFVRVAHVLIGRSADPNFYITAQEKRCYRKFVEINRRHELKRLKEKYETLSREVEQIRHFNTSLIQEFLDLISRISERVLRMFQG